MDAPDLTLRRLRANETIGDFRGELPAEAFTLSNGVLRFNDRGNPITKAVVDAKRSRIVVHLREVDIGPFAARPQKMTVTLGFGRIERSFEVIVGRSRSGLRY